MPTPSADTKWWCCNGRAELALATSPANSCYSSRVLTPNNNTEASTWDINMATCAASRHPNQYRVPHPLVHLQENDREPGRSNKHCTIPNGSVAAGMPPVLPYSSTYPGSATREWSDSHYDYLKYSPGMVAAIHWSGDRPNRRGGLCLPPRGCRGHCSRQPALLGSASHRNSLCP